MPERSHPYIYLLTWPFLDLLLCLGIARRRFQTINYSVSLVSLVSLAGFVSFVSGAASSSSFFLASRLYDAFSEITFPLRATRTLFPSRISYFTLVGLPVSGSMRATLETFTHASCSLIPP